MMAVVAVVVVVAVMLFATLQWVLGLKLQAPGINPYRGGVHIVCGNRTSVMMMMMVPMVIMVVAMMLFAALKLVLGLKLRIKN